jgi:hypothetical protein
VIVDDLCCADEFFWWALSESIVRFGTPSHRTHAACFCSGFHQDLGDIRSAPPGTPSQRSVSPVRIFGLNVGTKFYEHRSDLGSSIPRRADQWCSVVAISRANLKHVRSRFNELLNNFRIVTLERLIQQMLLLNRRFVHYVRWDDADAVDFQRACCFRHLHTDSDLVLTGQDLHRLNLECPAAVACVSGLHTFETAINVTSENGIWYNPIYPIAPQEFGDFNVPCDDVSGHNTVPTIVLHPTPNTPSPAKMIRRPAVIIFVFCRFADVGVAADSSFEKDLQPWLQAHCIRCHGVEKQEGEFRIDTLSPEVGVKDTPHWAEIIERITSGEMPPEGAMNQPSADESAKIVEWLAARIKEGESARMARRDRVSYHRLTREEYVNTVRDLIGVEYDAADPGGLLQDPEWNGFERLGSVLTLSPTHIEKYITAAEVVLAEAYPDKKVEYLELRRRAVEMQPGQPHYERLEEAGLLDRVRYPLTTAGELFRASSPFHGAGRSFPGSGVYEISYTVSGLKPEDQRPPRMQVYEHKLDRVLFEQDIIAPEDTPMTVTFRTHLVRHPEIHVINIAAGPRHPRNNASSRIPFITTTYPRAPWQMKITDEQGLPRVPVLILDSIAMRGPIVTDEEQRRRDEYMAATEGNMDQVRAGLETMARRAFRRPLKDGEVQTWLKITEEEIAAGEKFTDAVKSAMTAILCSKSFLFLTEGDQNTDRHTLNNWELASRLSYLIWSTMPDNELLRAAEQGRLHDKAELQHQLERMLADPRSDRFITSFPTQWLRLRKVGMFAPDNNIYPNYDSHLERSMIEEPLAFFGEVLRKALTLREFIDSDWTMVNPRLAGFYDLPQGTVDEFQRVSLNPDDHRGGLLTQAAILSLTSDGTRHRPVHRGVWLSESIFGKTPPPPPANVDPIEPNPINAPKATIRMKLQAHIHDARCASCHRNIDPLGMAFDNYNAIGEWRTHEKVEGTGDDPSVDASGVLPDGRHFANAKEFKQLLMADLDAFNATFIEKLATYGMRRTMSFEDRDELNEIAQASREKDYVVQSILEAFVLSDLFQKR